jgi:hypothetical protein
VIEIVVTKREGGKVVSRDVYRGDYYVVAVGTGRSVSAGVRATRGQLVGVLNELNCKVVKGLKFV